MKIVPCILMLMCAEPLQSGAQDLHVVNDTVGRQADVTWPDEDIYCVSTLPALRSGEVNWMFSSYDRSGKNDDGFSGTYSKLRLRDGNSVIADMQGAGCITRLWTTHTQMNKVNGVIRDGLFLCSGAHVRIFLDGAVTPQIDLPAELLFSGEAAGFPQPLVGRGSGGFYCYVPIFYTNGCRVEVEGDNVRFYQLNYTTYDSPDKVPNSGIDPRASTSLANTFAWGIDRVEGTGTQRVKHVLDAVGGEDVWVEFPAGKHRIDALVFNADDRAALLRGHLKLFWEGEDKPSVDLPLAHFVGCAPMTGDYRSVLTGAGPGGIFNLMPMPYRKRARMALRFPDTVHVELTATIARDVSDGAQAYLHTHYTECLPARRGEYVQVLAAEGAGHYIGTFMDTRRESLYGGVTTWLEGDEIFTVDGEERMHGTGTEDYFNCGWYMVPGRLNQPGIYPLHGFTVFSTTTPIKAAAAYRWHLESPIRFQKQIDLKLEHGEHNTHPADYRTTAFFYLDSP